MGSLKTNLSFLRRLVRCPMVIEGDTPTDLIARNPELTATASAQPSLEASLALAVFQLLNDSDGAVEAPTAGKSSAWQLISRREGVRL